MEPDDSVVREKVAEFRSLAIKTREKAEYSSKTRRTEYETLYDRLRFYILALTVAALGFAFSVEPRYEYQGDVDPWVSSVICWSISLLLGLIAVRATAHRYLAEACWEIDSGYLNIELFDMLSNFLDDQSPLELETSFEEDFQNWSSKYDAQQKNHERRTSLLMTVESWTFNFQLLVFFAGAIMFAWGVVWQRTI